MITKFAAHEDGLVRAYAEYIEAYPNVKEALYKEAAQLGANAGSMQKQAQLSMGHIGAGLAGAGLGAAGMHMYNKHQENKKKEAEAAAAAEQAAMQQQYMAAYGAYPYYYA